MRFTVLLIALIHNVSEASFNTPSLLWFVTLFAIVTYEPWTTSTSRRARHQRAPTAAMHPAQARRPVVVRSRALTISPVLRDLDITVTGQLRWDIMMERYLALMADLVALGPRARRHAAARPAPGSSTARSADKGVYLSGATRALPA
jgi:hypothetical protein